MSHTIKAAMDRGELTEEEAYFVLRFAGHRGYKDTMKLFRNPLSRLRRWLVWFGGWETPELCQWDMGWPAWKFNRDLTPVSLLGHRLTFFGWGVQMKAAGGYLVWTKESGLYWSPNGTPQHRDSIHLARL